MIRFHLDEHIDHEIAKALRRRGIDVTTTADAGLVGADDEQHIAFALSESRIIFTNDSDYVRLANSGIEHAGITYCAPNTRSIGEIVMLLSLLFDVGTEAEMKRRVEYF